ncbi:helix-turn-helix domain-containing protein, partial [Bacillus licheniformis]|uniref:helix-turn-helix domain-containing protein n=1 Tax=Bacillus licheniformis TaxID=1402 RepID=UPI0008FB2991
MKFNYNRLKAERIARGLTVQDMADFLGISKGTYSKKENGKIALTVEDFSLISNRLGIKREKIDIFFTKKDSDLATTKISQ